MFPSPSAHHQEVNEANCTYAASGIVILSCATASGCTRRSLAESDDTRGCICTICFVDFLMMSGLRSKHVEEFNLMYFVWMNKKFVYQIGNNKKVILWFTANQISRFVYMKFCPDGISLWSTIHFQQSALAIHISSCVYRKMYCSKLELTLNLRWFCETET